MLIKFDIDIEWSLQNFESETLSKKVPHPISKNVNKK